MDDSSAYVSIGDVSNEQTLKINSCDLDRNRNARYIMIISSVPMCRRS